MDSVYDRRGIMDTGAFEANLRKRGIVLKVFDTKEEAASYLTQAIKGKTVGFGRLSK